jgi:hypothetical protein
MGLCMAVLLIFKLIIVVSLVHHSVGLSLICSHACFGV